MALLIHLPTVPECSDHKCEVMGLDPEFCTCQASTVQAVYIPKPELLTFSSSLRLHPFILFSLSFPCFEIIFFLWKSVWRSLWCARLDVHSLEETGSVSDSERGQAVGQAAALARYLRTADGPFLRSPGMLTAVLQPRAKAYPACGLWTSGISCRISYTLLIRSEIMKGQNSSNKSNEEINFNSMNTTQMDKILTN